MSQSLYAFSFMFLFSIATLKGQTFVESSAMLGVDFSAGYQTYGSGVSCFDWNKDGLDDLTFAADGPPRFYQNNGNGFDIVNMGISNSLEGKSIIWVDYDNDGDSDLFLTRFFGTWSLYNNSNGQLTEVTSLAGLSQVGPYSSYGANWGDVNNDGWLDLYISNYSLNVQETNLFYLSNGDGTFTECASQRGIDNGNQLSFQGVFFDADMDGWQDLYVINDKQFTNTLYLNDGTGHFTDISQASGTDLVIDAMSNSIADFDNDGDLDIYMTNTDENKLLVNNADLTFFENAEDAHLAAEEFSWCAIWMDADADMMQDLFVATAPLSQQPEANLFYWADSNTDTFLLADNSGFSQLGNLVFSAATGDFNSDGMPDIAYSPRDTGLVDVWLNESDPANYIKVSLQGTTSNRDGIGSVIRCYSGGVQQMRYTYCGEQYMSQNSSIENFGLGGNTGVDSLSVTWLSGIVDVFYNIDVNETINIVEGSSSLTVSSSEAKDEVLNHVIDYSSKPPIVRINESAILTMYNANGQLVLTESINGDYPLGLLQPGLYLVSLQSQQGQNKVERVCITD